MAISLALAQAQIASLCLTTFLYGVFFALFVVTTAVVYHNASESTRQQRMKVLPVSFAMLLLATLYIVVAWIRANYGFVDRNGGSLEAVYEGVSHPGNIVKLACLCALSLISDSVMIWRMYVVYNKRFVVVAPAILLVVAYTVVACIVLNLMANFRAGADVFKAVEAWITVYSLLTMVTSVLCSGAIALRISVTGGPLRSVTTLWLIALVTVESSTLYALSVIATLATFLSGSNWQYPLVDAIVLLVGILIIPQIRFYVTSSTGPRSDGQLSNVMTWPGNKDYPLIDEDPEYLLLQTRTTVSMSNMNLHEQVSEIEYLKSPLLW